jgi:hypothetical protein
MPTSKQTKLKPYIYTHKNKMKNIGAAINAKTSIKQTKSKKNKKQKEQPISIRQLTKFTKENDPKFKNYSSNKRFIELSKKNPTIFVVNAIFLLILKSSFIDRLLKKENNELAKCIEHFILLDADKTKSSILSQLTKHGFNTIYDILLENSESIYLVSFGAHANTLGIVDNIDKFIKNLGRNKLHKDLRKREIIEQLQISNLYTRVKRYQLS